MSLGDALVSGRRAVVEALRSGRAKEVLIAAGSRSTEDLKGIRQEAERKRVPVRTVDRSRLAELGGAGRQGIAAVTGLPHEMNERDLATLEAGSRALVVALDGITDPQNLGACARSAEAAGAVCLVIRRRRAAPVSAAAVKASSGALLHLPVARVPNLPRAIEHLKQRGFWVVGLDSEADQDVYSASRPVGPMTLVVGSEGAGLSRLVKERCDALVSIPMLGRTASLNAASALAVGLFAYAIREAAP